MYPYWYEQHKKIECLIMGIGSLIILCSPLTDEFWRFYVPGFCILCITPILQRRRFKRLKMLENDPLRCECGGHFVLPSELGFDDCGVLICDNENGVGPGYPCEKWIVIPPDYQSSKEKANSNE